MNEISHGLIFANDIVESTRAKKISDAVAPFVDGIKIGITTTLESGTSIIKAIKTSTGKTIIADFKVADIGFYNKEKGRWEGTNAKIIANLADAGADYIICHSIVGTSSIQECIEVAHGKDARVLTLPYMTHKGAGLFFGLPVDLTHIAKVLNETGINVPQDRLNTCRTVSDIILVLGDALNIDGFIGPANNLGVLKRYRELSTKSIFGPGIGRQVVGGSSPKEQLERFFSIAGSKSAAIIGSAIYAAEEPAKAAREFADWRNEIKEKLTR